MKEKSNPAARARYDRNVLTLDLPRAVPPILSRIEIKNISNISFWVEPKENHEYILMMRLGGGVEQSIARFNNELSAEDSLAAIRTIFFNKKRPPGVIGLVLKYTFVIVLVWVLSSFAFQLTAGLMAHLNSPSSPANTELMKAPSHPAAPTPPVTSTTAPQAGAPHGN